jgi:hypothetical protein
VRAIFLDTVGWPYGMSPISGTSRPDGLTNNSRPNRFDFSRPVLSCWNAETRLPGGPNRRNVADLWLALERSSDLIYPTEAQVAAAWNTYMARPAGAAGIVDLVSFAVMRELGIREAFTNEAHFQAEGFETLMR